MKPRVERPSAAPDRAWLMGLRGVSQREQPIGQSTNCGCRRVLTYSLPHKHTQRSSFFDLSKLKRIEWMNRLNFCLVAEFFWIIIQFVNDIFSRRRGNISNFVWRRTDWVCRFFFMEKENRGHTTAEDSFCVEIFSRLFNFFNWWINSQCVQYQMW